MTELRNELSSHSSIFIITCNLGPSNQTKLSSLHWKATEASCSSNTDQQKSNSCTHAVMSLIIAHKGSSICSQVTSTIMKNERYWLHMSKAKMNFNTSVTYCLYAISSQLEPLDFRPKNPECATALCQIFSFATLKDLNDNILQTSSNLYCAHRDRIFIHSFSYQNLNFTSLAVLLTVVLQYEVSPATS